MIKRNSGFTYSVRQIEKLSVLLDWATTNKDEVLKMGKKVKIRIDDWSYDEVVGGVIESLNMIYSKNRRKKPKFS